MSILTRPRIIAVEAPHAPIALAGGHTLLRVVVEGSGALIVDGRRSWFKNGFDAMVPVAVAPVVTLRVVGVLGADRRDVALTPLSPAPAPVEVALPLPAVPSAVVPAAAVRLPGLRLHERRLCPQIDVRPKEETP